MNQQYAIGSSVYDADGTYVGTVNEQSVPGQYLAVERGVVIPGDIYVPVTAIKGAAPDGGVLLSLSDDDLTNEAYGQPPAATGATIRGISS